MEFKIGEVYVPKDMPIGSRFKSGHIGKEIYEVRDDVVVVVGPSSSRYVGEEYKKNTLKLRYILVSLPVPVEDHKKKLKEKYGI